MFDKHSHIKASLVSRVSQQQYAQLRVSCSTRLSYCHDASSIPATHQSFHVHHKASTQPSKHGHTRANSAATRSLKSSQSCGSMHVVAAGGDGAGVVLLSMHWLNHKGQMLSSIYSDHPDIILPRLLLAQLGPSQARWSLHSCLILLDGASPGSRETAQHVT